MLVISSGVEKSNGSGIFSIAGSTDVHLDPSTSVGMT